MANLLPNTQWVVGTAIGNATKLNQQGTGTQAAVAVSSYTTGSNTVVCNTSNTQQLKVGDLVFFQTPADANMRVCASRVDALVANTSFTVSLPLNYTASASNACNATPWGAGGSASVGSGDSFDGWSKSTTAQVWRDDFAANTKPGSSYSCGFIKGSSSVEQMWHQPQTRDVGRFAGKQIAFGVWGYQKVKSGTGTWRPYIQYDSTTVYGPSSTQTSYQWLEVTAAIPTTVTNIYIGVSFEGANNDTYYLSQPMCIFGPTVGQGNYEQPYHEIVVPKVKFSPITYVGAAVTFPSGMGSDFTIQVRPYAETNGAVAVTARKFLMHLEGRIDTTHISLGARNVVSPPITYGLLCESKVVGAQEDMDSWLTLDGNGDFILYSGTSAAAWYNVSIDINGYEL